MSAQSYMQSPYKSERVLGLSTGTKGILGIDMLFKAKHNFNLRIGINFFDIAFSNHERKFGQYGKNVSLAGDFKLSSLEALIERPFWKDRLRIVGGLAFFYANEFSVQVALAETTTINDLILSPEEVGHGRGTIWWRSPVSPYIGLAIGRAVPEHRWNITGEVGTYFKGAPSFRLEATNLLRTNERNEQAYEDRLQFLQWFPVISVRVGYKLNT